MSEWLWQFILWMLMRSLPISLPCLALLRCRQLASEHFPPTLLARDHGVLTFNFEERVVTVLLESSNPIYGNPIILFRKWRRVWSPRNGKVSKSFSTCGRRHQEHLGIPTCIFTHESAGRVGTNNLRWSLALLFAAQAPFLPCGFNLTISRWSAHWVSRVSISCSQVSSGILIALASRRCAIKLVWFCHLRISDSFEIGSATISQDLNPCVIWICRFLSGLVQRVAIHSDLWFFETCTIKSDKKASMENVPAAASTHAAFRL